MDVTKTLTRTSGYMRKQAMFLGQRVHARYIFIHILKCGGTSVEAALNLPKTHDTAFIRRRRVGFRSWEQAFTFSVVRHPYSKVISHYRHRRRHDETGLRSTRISLNEWIRRSYGARDPEYYDEDRWFAPCKAWLSDENGNLIVDYIAKLETIKTDWEIIQRRIGREVVLPHQNKARRDAGNWDVLDAESLRIINARFRDDFAAFGYEAF